jgi:tetratricopeptide (TPR) repeat protein
MTEKEIGQKEIEEKKKEILDLKRKKKTDEALFMVSGLIEDLKYQTDMVSRLAIGWLLHQTGNIFEKTVYGWEESKAWYNAAFVYRCTFDPIGTAYTIFQLAMLEETFNKNGEDVLPYFLKAKPYVEKAMDILQGKVLRGNASSKDKEDYGNMLHNLAYILQRKGDIKKAKINYQIALDCRHITGDKRGEGLTLARLAEIEGDIEVAEKYLDDAYKIFDSIGDVDRLKQVRKTREGIQKKKDKK